MIFVFVTCFNKIFSGHNEICWSTK